MSKDPQTLYAVEDGVAVITLSFPPMNALHPKVLGSLFDNVRRAHADPSAKAIVITGANGRFCAGFDINQFQDKSRSGGGIDMSINTAFVELVETGPKPTVAAIEKLALGGGCELALACNARVAAPGTIMGLPELTLGILPGFGGTQRLPRVVGLEKALSMILTSKPIKDPEALSLGLLDAVVPPRELLATARKLALDLASGARTRRFALQRTDRLPAFREALATLEFARAQTRRRAPNLTHPLLALDAVQAGVERGGAAGLRAEAEAFAAAAALPTHGALVHVFFAQRSTKRVRGVTDVGLAPRGLRRLAVLGGGLMGSGIATASALAGIEVLLKEINQGFLDAGLARIRANLASGVKRGSLKQAAADAALARVTGTLTYDEFGSVDMVIEAAIEQVELKQRIFADLERVTRPACILATNTSTIDIKVVGAKTRSQDRIIGAHFFSPAHIMPLLEIVRSDVTSPQVILDTLDYGSRIKKTPVVVGNCTGFAVNRVFFPYSMAAAMLVDSGLDPYRVDAAVAAFGMPMGPFRLGDLVGLDVSLFVGKSYLEAFPERIYRSALVPLLNEAGRLGEKAKKGWYVFDDKRKARPDPALAEIVLKSRKRSGLSGNAAFAAKLSDQDIAEFVFFPVINEACRVVAEGIVDKPADLDVATVMSMGFPAYRGGVVFYGDIVGADYVVRRLKQWATQYKAQAGFFEPCEYLLAAAKSGRKLSAGNATQSKI
ncbi:ECH3 [Auxenochlorella protothecoides x Auxenochlorella symbiontica]